MITEKKIVEILKQFEQQDFKRGGVSIDPSNYNAIARTVVKNCSIPDVVGRSEQLICGRNITTCVFYKEGGKCSNLEYCRDQTT